MLKGIVLQGNQLLRVSRTPWNANWKLVNVFGSSLMANQKVSKHRVRWRAQLFHEKSFRKYSFEGIIWVSISHLEICNENIFIMFFLGIFQHVRFFVFPTVVLNSFIYSSTFFTYVVIATFRTFHIARQIYLRSCL